MTEIAIIGSDIQEVIGSAIALYILFGLPIYIGVLLTILDTMLVLLIQVKKMDYIEYLFVAFVGVMSVCFAINMIMIDKDGSAIASGLFIPSVPKGSTEAALGLIGAIIMPHNLYLHTSLVDTRKLTTKNRSNINKLRDVINYFTLDAAFSLFLSFFVNLCIIITFANISQIANGKYTNLTIGNAGKALDEVFGGNSGTYIWGIGLLAAGQSATITGTMSGQFVMQGFLNLKISRTQRSLISRGLAIIPSIIVTFCSSPEEINEQLNILQAVQLPFAVIPLLVFSNDQHLMGLFRIGRCLYYCLIMTSFLMVVLNIYTIIPPNFDGTRLIDFAFMIGTLFYLGLIVMLIRQKANFDYEDLEVKDEDKEIEGKEATASLHSNEDDQHDYEEFQLDNNQNPFMSNPTLRDKASSSFR